MRVMVLGANGFIGRHIVHALGEHGHEVVAATRRGEPLGLATAGKVTNHAVDLLARPEDLASLFLHHPCEVIINAAGCTTGKRAELVRGNALLVSVLLDVLAATPEDLRPRLVHLGSAAEYAAPQGREAVRTDHPVGPSGPYGITKLCGTSLVLASIDEGSAPGTVLRLFNPVGPGSPENSLAGSAARRFRVAVDEGLDSVRFGRLDSERDFVDVRDVAEAAVKAAAKTGPLPRLLNIGSGRASPAMFIVEALARAASFSGRIDASGAGSPRSAVPWLAADIRETTTSLDWRPSRSLHTSMNDLWEEHRTGLREHPGP